MQIKCRVCGYTLRKANSYRKEVSTNVSSMVKGLREQTGRPL